VLVFVIYKLINKIYIIIYIMILPYFIHMFFKNFSIAEYDPWMISYVQINNDDPQ
jgi:hypothetical protein